MKTLITELTKSSFIKNVAIVASGTAAAQVVSMVLSPIVTRLYGPEAYGIMGTFSAFIGVIIPISALTYPIAIVLPKSEKGAKGIISLSLLITGIVSLIIFFIILIFQDLIVNTLNLSSIEKYLYLVPLVLFFSGCMQTIEQWLIRIKQFTVNAKVTFLHSVLLNGSKVGIGLFNPSATVLVLLTSFSYALKAIMMVIFNHRRNKKQINKITLNIKDIVRLAKEYIDFPLYRAPEEFLNAISRSLPVLMLTSLFGPASAGFYSLGKTVLNLPAQLIGKSVGDVFYPRIAEAANNEEDVTNLIKKATYSLAIVGIVPFGLIILFGPSLFSLIFGGNWITAGEYARWIALWSFFGFLNRPSVKALPVLSAQKFQLFYTIFMLATRILVMLIGYFLFTNDLITVALFGITGALLNFGLILITLGISRKRIRKGRKIS